MVSGAKSVHLVQTGVRISHETIYRRIRKDKAKGGSLYKNFRHRLKHRKRPVGGCRMSIPNRVGIAVRPMEADEKRFGDFEMDTIVGKGRHGIIVTLIEEAPICY
jgi:IS30 family transposase